ncbi:MAG: PDZ domain-containing protein [Pseudomonadota bacterium]|nr:PDZ domain-containing protein [Pseudomonadota bacterium]
MFRCVLGLVVLIAVFATTYPADAKNKSLKLPMPKEDGRSSAAMVMLKRISQELATIAEMSRKAIVFVSTSKTISMPYGVADPFEFFFGTRRSVPEYKRKHEGLGSGFFIDLKQGYILTNNHVVAEADEITLKLANGEQYDGRVAGRDASTDIAVLEVVDKKFSRKGLRELLLADSSKVVVGELAFALGAPFGLESSLSLGIVSAVGRRDLRITDVSNFIQTDAAINPGNSGGPLLNSSGHVIGLNTAIYTRSGGYNGIGFAVPSNLARRVAEQLVSDGHVQRGYLGVRLQTLDDNLRNSLRLPRKVGGVLVSQVVANSPAAKAGFEPGDVIVAVNNRRLKDSSDLRSTIGLLKPGTKAKVSIYRDGRSKNLFVTIGGYNEQLADSGKRGGAAKKQAHPQLGMSLKPVNDNLRRLYGFESTKGLVVTDIVPNSPAARAGLREGDVLVSVDGKTISSQNSFQNLIKKYKKSSKLPLIRVERQRYFFYISLRM